MTVQFDEQTGDFTLKLSDWRNIGKWMDRHMENIQDLSVTEALSLYVKHVQEKERKKSLHDGFQGWARRFNDHSLATFPTDETHRKRANQYARENPDKTGFIKFSMNEGGFQFYRVENGKAQGASAYQMYLELEHGIMDWWNH